MFYNDGVMKQRLLVTGGAGFLGTHLLHQAQNFIATGTLHRTAATSIPSVSYHVCDLLEPQEVRILLDRVKPDIIIHTACSDQGGNLSAIAPAAGLLAAQAAERDIRLIHLSTDQVFNGMTAPYDETSETNPINSYGSAKSHAEYLVRSLNTKATIVRTSLLYDLRTPDRQTRQLIQTTQTKEPYNLFTDEFRCPIWVENLAEVLLELAQHDYEGTLNVGGPERLNRWELGMKLLHHFDVSPTPNIKKGTIQKSGLERPKDLTLDSAAAHQLLTTPLLSIEEAQKVFKNT